MPRTSPATRSPASIRPSQRWRACRRSLEATARIVADTASTADCGDHTLFIGHIRWMAADNRPPLLYHASRYAYLVAAPGEDVPQPEFW